MAGNKLPTGIRRRCLHVAIAAWIAGAAVPSLGQVTQLERLISESDAIVTVEVAFVPYGDMVLIGDVLHGKMVKLSNSNELLGACLPNKARVRKLVKMAAGPSQAVVYEGAIERASYKAVVFLKHGDGDGASRALCDEGAHVTDNWESDPRYEAWRTRLDVSLRDLRR
ncbi:MAG: hypothetical protein GTO41_02435 [Burkholderiales bacterium]|nr:hypothetical protein [Burkholderiales bacterium]